MKLITLETLIEKARIWLKKRCVVVVTETHTSNTVPVRGALGWSIHQETIAVECAADRAAFLRKVKKLPDYPYGDYRLILTVPNVCHGRQELPPGWGLLVYDGSRRSVSYEINAALQSAKNSRAELTVIISMLRRVGRHAADCGEDWIDAYEWLTESHATLSVAALANYLEADEEEIDL